MRDRRRRPPRRILRPTGRTHDQVVGLALAHQGRDVAGMAALVVCARVGGAPFVPRGYQTADCSKCGSAVWISPDIVNASEARGMIVRPLCGECLKPDGGRAS